MTGISIDRILAEAEIKGTVTEALSQAAATAMTLEMFVAECAFDEWPAFCDERGWRSGPRTREVLRSHGMVFAMLADGLK